MGLMGKVERNDHKGFDYSALLGAIEAEFDIIEVGGLPIRGFPPSLSATVTVVARSKGFCLRADSRAPSSSREPPLKVLR
jgi:hypothetical protein